MTSVVAIPAAAAVAGNPRPPSNRLRTKRDAPAAKYDTAACPVIASPSVVHFGGFELEKPHRLSLKLLNTSSAPLRYTLTPPTSPFFTVRCVKNEVFVPGIPDTVDIEFTPTEHRYYFDTITITCETGDTLLVPMHAYPVLAEVSVPPSFDFGTCPIQQPAIKTFALRCDVPIEFEFKVNVISSNPVFSVSPLSGAIPPKGEACITVKYTPADYTTSSFAFEVLVSEYNSRPLRCTVLGSCAPGALTNAMTKRAPSSPPARTGSASRTRTIRIREKKETARPQSMPPAEPEQMVVDGLVIPRRLVGMAAINAVLNQAVAVDKDAKSPLVGPTYRKTHDALQREFALEVRQLSLRLPGLGEEELSHEARRDILAARRIAEEQYAMAKKTGPVAEAEALARLQTRHESGVRVVRSAAIDVGDANPTFVQRSQLSFASRMQALQRFLQAGRQVILQARLRRRLHLLKQHHQRAKDGDASAFSSQDLTIAPPAGPLEPLQLPVYESASMPVHAPRVPMPAPLPSVTLPPQPFIDLIIPEYYKQQGYSTYSVTQAVYLPTELDRPLRHRSEALPPPPTRAEKRASAVSRSMTTKPPHQPAAAAAAAAATTTTTTATTATSLSTTSTIVPPSIIPHPPKTAFGARPAAIPEAVLDPVLLNVPAQLLAPNLPACSLNPIPGVSAVLQPLLVGETDDDHLLHPFADSTVPHARLLTTTMTADIVPESMCMTHEAISMAVVQGQSSLSRYWIPRCTDPFVDTLPTDAPPLLDHQPEEDALVNAAAPPPLPAVESLFFIPHAPAHGRDSPVKKLHSHTAAAGVGISVTERDSTATTAATPTVGHHAAATTGNFANDTTLLIREEREAICVAAATQVDTFALRLAERENRLLHATNHMGRAKSAESSVSRL